MTWHVCLIPPIWLLHLIIRQGHLIQPLLLLLKIPSSRMCPSTVRLVIFTTELHGVVTLREYVETVAPLPTVDVKSVTVIRSRKTVSEQGVQRVTSIIKERNCADISSRALEANKHGCTRKINICEKNLGKDKERTTGAEDTQNQHYQRVRTIVDSWVLSPPALVLPASARSSSNGFRVLRVVWCSPAPPLVPLPRAARVGLSPELGCSGRRLAKRLHVSLLLKAASSLSGLLSSATSVTAWLSR